VIRADIAQTRCEFSGNAEGALAIARAAIDASEFAKAREALSQAGKPGGFSFTAALYNENARQEAELIQAQLRRVGIEMQLDILDLATFTQRYRRAAHSAFCNGENVGAGTRGLLEDRPSQCRRG